MRGDVPGGINSSKSPARALTAARRTDSGALQVLKRKFWESDHEMLNRGTNGAVGETLYTRLMVDALKGDGV